MAFTRADLFVDVCDALKEPRVLPDSNHPTAIKIRAKEVGCAEMLLAMHPWNFARAIERGQLDAEADLDAEEPAPSLGGCLYAWKLGKIINLIWVASAPHERARMVRGWSKVGARVLSDQTPIYFCGVSSDFALQAAYGAWPRLFGKAVAAAIADEISGPVVNSRATSLDLSERTRAIFEEAALYDANQSSPAPKRRGRWVRNMHSRMGGSTNQ